MSTFEQIPGSGPGEAVCLPTSQERTSRQSSTAIEPAPPRNETFTVDHKSLAVVEADDGDESTEKNDLPRADGGVAAWRFLAAAFVIEATMWGFTLTFGVFQAYYERHEGFSGSKNIAVIGTIMTGLPFLGAPIATAISSRFCTYQRAMILGGWLCCIIGLVGASFAQTVAELILTQGVTYGLGVLVYYYPILSMQNEWFEKRRGLAYGVTFGAEGLSGLGLPYLVEKLLQKYGFATTLRCYAIGSVIVTLPALFFLRRRLPHTTTIPLQTQSLSIVLKTFKFWSFTTSSLFQGIAFSIPSIFLPTFAYSLSLPSYTGPLLLAIFNIFQAFSDLLLGYLSDHLPISALIFSSSFIAGVCAMLLWGLAPLASPPLALLVVFAALYGGAAGGYSVLYPRMATALTEDEADKRTLYGIWCFERGVGNVLAGPLSGVLVRGAVKSGVFGAGRFRGLIAFTGSCLLVSAIAVIGSISTERSSKQKKTEEGEGA